MSAVAELTTLPFGTSNFRRGFPDYLREMAGRQAKTMAFEIILHALQRPLVDCIEHSAVP